MIHKPVSKIIAPYYMSKCNKWYWCKVVYKYVFSLALWLVLDLKFFESVPAETRMLLIYGLLRFIYFLWLIVPAWKTVSNTRIRYTVLEFVKKLRNWLTENHSATMLSYKGRKSYSFSLKWKQIDVVSNALVAKKTYKCTYFTNTMLQKGWGLGLMLRSMNQASLWIYFPLI